MGEELIIDDAALATSNEYAQVQHERSCLTAFATLLSWQFAEE